MRRNWDRRIHLLEAVDLRRLQNVQSRQNLHGERKTASAQRPHPNKSLFKIKAPAGRYIVVFEEAQHPQLSEDPLAGDQVLEDVGHLLQSHLPAVPRIGHRPVRKRGARFLSQLEDSLTTQFRVARSADTQQLTAAQSE